MNDAERRDGLDRGCAEGHNRGAASIGLLACKQKTRKDSVSLPSRRPATSLSSEPLGERDGAFPGPALVLTVSTRTNMSSPHVVPPPPNLVPSVPLEWGVHRRFVNGRVEHFAVGWTGVELPFAGLPIGDETEADVIGRLYECLCVASPRPLSEPAGPVPRLAWPPRAGRPALQLVRA